MGPFPNKLKRLPSALRRSLRSARRTLRDIRRLLRKEIKIAASPLTYFFIAFGAMTLLPGYPILLGAMFVCLGTFYSFQAAREAGDILYTALLPVKKTDVVLGKYGFVCCVEMAAFVLMAALTAVRMTALRDAPVYVNNALMAANPFFLGFALLIFAVFNLLFVGGFFKTAYNFGRPLVYFMLAAAGLVVLGEALHHIPGLGFLNAVSGGALGIQYAILAACAALYVFGAWRACRRAMARFEKIDL